ncbi:quinone oxidoreductase, YhdH/YhfP family protein [Paraburkholderia xenovorans LB400]|jgi:acrylyl-CoA reductase (NADPH)|uniref:Zinc-containing alcohol dehydrogenase superfamily n=1 Tax=Paraburkholderia xenovorans (strain LB400) TaxID=266265 RepID=Q13PB3_PARXL|nr:MDR family oxidoreductase [Paraburkholderia xenovorans]ABE34076.1 Zinc-containing alcohol dehydrogenase superfamily [Paraburkholderia xenovorans LB400]AIP36978.1 quinone oxidoreductase, YhdH/YhfP family protein [Paraburkholderia xenovorans LB400]
MFKAILLDRQDSGTVASVTDLEDSQLPEGDVTVRVDYSTLNYKDGLAITGKGPVVRKFPMVPGIDFAGIVEASSDSRYQPGDAVVLNGWGVGETHWGGLAQKARVKADWLLPLPDGMSARHAMSIGTAGYTAMLCVLAIAAHGVTPGQGDILVTGANGGVGGVAIALLAKRGYRVVASTGRLAETDHLKALGAADVIDRNELSSPGKPLAKERWAATVDSVGSHTLANACAATRYGGIVTACGLAQGMDFPGNVAPFILRGITLRGIDSVMAPFTVRQQAWQALAKELPESALEALVREVSLGEAPALASDLLAGKVRGRVIVAVNA